MQAVVDSLLIRTKNKKAFMGIVCNVVLIMYQAKNARLLTA